MNDQFIDLSIPNPNVEYYCDIKHKSTGFTHLMKLVLLIGKFTRATTLIKEIIDTHPNEIYRKNNEGWSALMIACRNCTTHSSIECVKMLLDVDYGINDCDRMVNFKNSNGFSALMLAIIYCKTDSSMECVNALIKSGADVNLQNNDGWSALTMICLRYASRRNARESSMMRFGGENGTFSKTTGDNECIKILLDSGANIDLQDKCGITPLMIASRHCNGSSSLECVQILVRLGANVNLCDNNGQTALNMACAYCNEKSSLDCVKILLKVGANPKSKNNSLMRSIKDCDANSSMECIKLLLKSGADVNYQDEWGITPLILACGVCDMPSLINCVKLLLKSGANVNYQLRKQHTCLLFVCSNYGRSGYMPETFDKLIKLLIKFGADANLPDGAATVPLTHYCCKCNFEKSSVDTLLLLINKTTCVVTPNVDGKTAYHNFTINPTSKYIVDDNIHLLLKGDIKLSNTKSATKIVN